MMLVQLHTSNFQKLSDYISATIAGLKELTTIKTRFTCRCIVCSAWEALGTTDSEHNRAELVRVLKSSLFRPEE